MLMMMAMTIISWEKKKGSQQRQLVAQNFRFLRKVYAQTKISSEILFEMRQMTTTEIF